MKPTQLTVNAIETLGWLADAPLFIDSEQVKSFYEAVARPEHHTGALTVSMEGFEGGKTAFEGKLGAEVGTPAWLRLIFPFLDARISAEGAGAHEIQQHTQKGATLQLLPVDSPQRQLVQLALHYAMELGHRTAFVPDPSDSFWLSPDFLSQSPRALAFVDFPPSTQFIPMAVEVANGHVETIFDRLGPRLGYDPPSPPDSRKFREDEDSHKLDQMWTDYWKWFSDHFSHRISTEVIEEIVAEGGGRVRWIDYRVPIAGRDKPLHLHVSGRERFDTGVFAYNLVQRGYSNGLRIVGSLRAGPSLNVMAIFDK